LNQFGDRFLKLIAANPSTNDFPTNDFSTNDFPTDNFPITDWSPPHADSVLQQI
jgi:hypothetical protein